MDAAISIGGSVKVENVVELGEVIVRILEAGASDHLKEEALETLTRVAKVENLVLNNVNVDGGKTIHVT